MSGAAEVSRGQLKVVVGSPTMRAAEVGTGGSVQMLRCVQVCEALKQHALP